MPELLAFTAPVELTAAADGAKVPRVAIVAYTGGIMRVAGWGEVALELKGLDVSGQVPILVDHDASLQGIAGHGLATIERSTLLVNGTIPPVTDAARQVVELSKAGFQFQASVGVQPSRNERVNAGETIAINGQTITAGSMGLTLIRAGKLKEVSITSLAADAQTSVAVAASRKGTNMADETTTTTTTPARVPDFTRPEDFPNDMRHPWDRDGLTDGERIVARAQGFFREYGSILPDAADGLLKAASIGGITWGDFDRQVLAAENRALRLRAIRAERPQAPIITARNRGGSGGDVLQAALLLHLGQEGLGERVCGADVMQRGRELGAHSLLDVLKAGLTMEQREVPASKDGLIRAAFSTHSITTMLTTTGNKLLLGAYQAFPSAARLIARKLTAGDFKSHTGYRLTGDTVMEEVGAAGEIHHGTLGQASYAFSVKTFARMFGLTRQDIINDDLGAFEEVPRMLGRGAAIALEEAFWTLVLANTGSFFHADNDNLIDDALDLAGLGVGVETMMKQTDQDGHPISVLPRFLVVPPELKATADSLYRSTTIVAAGTAGAVTKLPGSNMFFGLYEPVASPYPSNVSFSGNSTTGWYLFGDPADVAAFGIGYLDGVESPTIEQSDVDFSMLGIQWRGYFDFGVCQIDPRGAVKSSGDGQA